MTVLVTGGSGFLGINLIRFLHSQGVEEVRVLDIADFDYPEKSEPWLKFTKGDVRDVAAVEEVVAGCDVIVHAAAALPLYSAEDIRSTEVDGCRNVLNAARKFGVGRMIQISSTAVYGSRGANGVVLVTTRKGESGNLKITFDSKVTVSSLRKNYELMDAYEYAQALNDIRGAGTISDGDMEAYRTGQKGIDWVDLMTRTAVTQDYSLTFSGGNDKVRYLVSGNVLDQPAVTIESKYQRYGLRANLEADVRPWLTVSTNINASSV